MNITVAVILQVNGISHLLALHTLYIIAMRFGAKFCHTVIAIACCSLRVGVAMTTIRAVTVVGISNGLVGTCLHTAELVVCDVLKFAVYILAANYMVTVDGIHGIQHNLIIVGLAVHDFIRSFGNKLNLDIRIGLKGDIREIHDQLAA